jgi:hypothetical protein
VTAATLAARTVPPGTLRVVTAATAIEEPLVSAPAELPPLALTGDDETDEALALIRETTGAIHDAQERVADLSRERKRLVLTLRGRGVKFGAIAAAAGSTEQTIFKIHREGRRDQAEGLL